MIAGRFLLLSRVDRAWRRPFCLANALSAQAQPRHFQGIWSHSCNLSSVVKVGGNKVGCNAMDRNKRRKAVFWKPVSTHSDVQSDELSNGQNLSLDESTSGLCSDADHVKKSGVVENKEHISSYQVESSFEKKGRESGSLSVVSVQQEQVMEEIPLEVDSGKDAEFTNGVDMHSMPIQVDASLIRFLKGKGGSALRQIEEETTAKIIFRSSKEDTAIVIEGTLLENVTKASEKIASVIDEAVKSPSIDYSHFVSLPLAIHPELVKKLQDFQETIIQVLGDANFGQEGNQDSDSNEDNLDDNDGDDKQPESRNISISSEVQDDMEHVRLKMDATSANPSAVKSPRSSNVPDLGIDSSIFIKPKTFHLTVLMLKLWNKELVAAATEVLQKVSAEVMDALDNRPISITLKGLECMRGSAARARILYAPVEEIGGEGRLLRACQVIRKAYIEAGLVLEKDARQSLKLHATLMNAKHRKRKKGARRRDWFDARGILRRYGREEWGGYLIREAHLSQRFVYDDKGYYHCCTSIPFPGKHAN